MRKHNYTEAEAPTNTGSLSRPGRLNLRLDCQVRARTHKAFIEVRELTGMPADASYADVWEQKILPLVEHAVWNAKNAPSSTRNFVMSLFRPLEKSDWLRNRYQELKRMFERVTQPQLF